MSKSKDNILSEAQVRRFMGLAGIQGLSERYTSELGAGGMYGDREEEDIEVADLEMGGEPAPEEDLGMDFPGEEEAEGGAAATLPPEEKQDLAAAVVQAVAQELEAALQLDEPIEVAVEDEMEAPLEEPGEELELDLGAELEEPGEELEEPLQEDKTANKGHGHGKQVTNVANKATGRWLKEEEDEELAEVVDDEEVVNEVLRRVVARLANG